MFWHGVPWVLGRVTQRFWQIGLDLHEDLENLRQELFEWNEARTTQLHKELQEREAMAIADQEGLRMRVREQLRMQSRFPQHCPKRQRIL